jgi:hypothetical protein
VSSAAAEDYTGSTTPFSSSLMSSVEKRRILDVCRVQFVVPIVGTAFVAFGIMKCYASIPSLALFLPSPPYSLPLSHAHPSSSRSIVGWRYDYGERIRGLIACGIELNDEDRRLG